jgi:hypothetical protein
MKTVDQIRKQLTNGEFSFSHHAFRRAVERNISEAEICQAGAAAEVVEAYPTDKYSASCLLLGYTKAGRALHLQVSQANTELVKIITLYEPDLSQWDETYTTRR